MPTLCFEAPSVSGARGEAHNPTVATFRTRKGASLAAYLALYPGAQDRGMLAARFWPEATEAAARKSLTMEVSDLRKRLENAAPPDAPTLLCVDRETIGFLPEAFTSDIALFRSQLHKAWRTDNLSARKALLVEAVALWSPLLPALDASFLTVLREQHITHYIRAVAGLSEILEVEGRIEEALSLLEEAGQQTGDCLALRKIAQELHRCMGTASEALPSALRYVAEEQTFVSTLYERARRRGNGGETAKSPYVKAAGEISLSLAEAMEAEVGRLSLRQQQLYTQLAFFEGPFLPKLVAAVCQVRDAASALASLHKARLLVTDETGRYRMLIALRSAALARLEEAEKRTLARRHRDYWAKVVGAAISASTVDSMAKDAITPLRPDWPCILQALDQSLEMAQEPEKAIFLFRCIQHFAERLGLTSDLLPFIVRALTLSEQWDSLLRGHVHGLAYRCLPQNSPIERERHLHLARKFFEEVPEKTLEDRRDIGHLFFMEARNAHHKEEHEQAGRLFGDAMEVYHATYHPMYQTAAGSRAENLLYRGRADEAIPLYQEAEQSAGWVGESTHQRATRAWHLAGMHHYLGDYGQARQYANQSLGLGRREGNAEMTDRSLRLLAVMQMEQGYFAEAEQRFTESIARLTETKDWPTRAVMLGNLGDNLQAQGDLKQAESLYQEGLTVWREHGHKGWASLFLVRLGLNALHQGKPLVAKQYTDLASPLCQASQSWQHIAICRYTQGRIAIRVRKYDAARQALTEALQLWEKCRYPLGIARTKEALATLLHALDDPGATEHRQAALRLRERMETPLPPIEEGAVF